MAGVGGVGIQRTHHDRTKTGLDDGVDARRRAAMRAARLQSDVQNSVRLRPTPEIAQHHDLGVRLTRLSMKAFRDNRTVLGNHRAHHRIRMSAPPGLPGELQGSTHRGLGRHRRQLSGYACGRPPRPSGHPGSAAVPSSNGNLRASDARCRDPAGFQFAGGDASRPANRA